MGPAKVLTNFLLLYPVVLVLLMLGLGIAFHPFDSAARLLTFFVVLVGINTLGAVVAGIVQVKLRGKESIWLQPASERAERDLQGSNNNVMVAALYIGIGGRPRTPEAERAVRDKYILDYTRDEQAKRGIDCHKLKPDLLAFLQQKIDPLVRARKPRQKWDALVTEEIRSETEKLRQHILTCGMLYKAGRNGEVNDLRELSYLPAIEDAFLTMAVLIRHGAPSQNCGTECLDNRFGELESAYRRVVSRFGLA